MRRYLSLVVCITSVACIDPEAGPSAAVSSALVYGQDDRQEVYRLPADAGLRAATRAVAAIIPRKSVRYAADGRAQILAPTLEHAEQLCPDEPFAQQPSAAECTAVLIDDNLLATAGHCFASAWDCQDYFFVFDYAYESETLPLQLGSLELYECSRARIQEDDQSPVTRPSARSDGEPALTRDYAIVELTRRVEGRVPILIRHDALALGESLSVVSATAGVPLKVDVGGRVLETRDFAGDYFYLDADTFHGSSGAPVLDTQAALVGLIARGNADYVYDAPAGCYRVAKRGSPAARDAQADGPVDAGAQVHELEEALPAADGRGVPPYAEQASRIQPAVGALCAGGYPSLRLCGIAPRCGDRICSPDETSEACLQDCPSVVSSAADAGAIAPPMAGSGSGPEPTGMVETGTSGSTPDVAGCQIPSGPASAAPGSWVLLVLGWSCARRYGKRGHDRR